MSGEMRLFAYMAVPCWALWVWAFVDMLLGNPTAINGVIGIGLGASIISAAALALRRQDRPQHAVPPKPDYAKIERLERELGLVESPKRTPIRRVIDHDGEGTEIRSWGS